MKSAVKSLFADLHNVIDGKTEAIPTSAPKNSNASVEDVEESFDKLFAAINGIVIPAPVEKKMREEFEGTKEKPTPVKNEEIRRTTSQTKKWLQGSHVPVSLTDVTEELGEEVEAPLQDAEWDHNKVVKTKVQQNSNCYNFQNQWVEKDQTPASTKQAPRLQQVLRYLNIKFYATLTSRSRTSGPDIKLDNVMTSTWEA